MLMYMQQTIVTSALFVASAVTAIMAIISGTQEPAYCTV